jgi:23S rRNA (pseudouridine1915-N3)-methyltransferase
MRLAVVAVGRLKDGPERELCQRYAGRIGEIGRSLGFSGPDLVELPESRARREDDRKREEADLIAVRAPAGLLIVLDERGTSLPSPDFAARLGRERDAGNPAASFVIGGADGLDASLRDRAAIRLSFGALTIPHQIVRVLVLEQIYRALTILSGHPYHRG